MDVTVVVGKQASRGSWRPQRLARIRPQGCYKQFGLPSVPWEPSKLKNGVPCGPTLRMALVVDGLLAPEEKQADGQEILQHVGREARIFLRVPQLMFEQKLNQDPDLALPFWRGLHGPAQSHRSF